MSAIPQATTLDKLMMIPKTGQVLLAAFLRLLTAPLTGGPKASTTFKDFVFAALRANFNTINAAQEQWVNTTTASNYLDFAKKTHFEPVSDTLASGLKCYWFGPKKAEKVVLYFHGGGYVLGASPGHLKWLFDLQRDLSSAAGKKGGSSVSVVMPAYTLAPEGQYPLQMQQGVESLKWLLTDLGKKPSDIIIAGDSAGGNLALAVLSHTLHPHDEIDAQTKLVEPLAGVVLISPWVYFDTQETSMHRNYCSDYVTPTLGKRWAGLFMGQGKQDPYNQPALAPADWFNSFDTIVKDILIWGGGGETLIDSIDAIAKTLKQAHPRTTYVVAPGAAHEDFIIEKMLGYTEKAEGTRVIEGWIGERL